MTHLLQVSFGKWKVIVVKCSCSAGGYDPASVGVVDGGAGGKLEQPPAY